MKERLSPLQEMEKIFDMMQQFYSDYDKKANGIIQFIQQEVEIKSKDMDKVNQWWVERLED